VNRKLAWQLRFVDFGFAAAVLQRRENCTHMN
jgi:hypothetical protein